MGSIKHQQHVPHLQLTVNCSSRSEGVLLRGQAFPRKSCSQHPQLSEHEWHWRSSVCHKSACSREIQLQLDGYVQVRWSCNRLINGCARIHVIKRKDSGSFSASFAIEVCYTGNARWGQQEQAQFNCVRLLLQRRGWNCWHLQWLCKRDEVDPQKGRPCTRGRRRKQLILVGERGKRRR